MRRTCIGHHANGWLRQPGQVIDLAGVIGTHLDDGIAVIVAEPRQCQRQADVIVQVALRGKCLAALRQDRAGHRAYRGLAIAAGDGNHRQLEAVAPVRGKPAQRQACIVHPDLRQADRAGPAHCSGGSTLLPRRFNIGMAVEIRPLQREKQ